MASDEGVSVIMSKQKGVEQHGIMMSKHGKESESKEDKKGNE